VAPRSSPWLTCQSKLARGYLCLRWHLRETEFKINLDDEFGQLSIQPNWVPRITGRQRDRRFGVQTGKDDRRAARKIRPTPGALHSPSLKQTRRNQTVLNILGSTPRPKLSMAVLLLGLRASRGAAV